MNVYLIKNGIVENVVVVESLESAVEIFPDYTVVDATGGEASIGWTYAGGLFAPPTAQSETLEQTVAQHDVEIEQIVSGLEVLANG